MKASSCICLILLTLVALGSSLEPLTIVGGIVGIGSALTAVWQWEPVRCRLTECCNDRWIIKNFTGLMHDLTSKLHGQHIARSLVYKDVRTHFMDENPRKALVLSFHGPTGVGKTFVSSILAENMYRNDQHSSFVHLISAVRDFPHVERQALYKNQLQSWIEGNVTKCERSLFIFEEIDKLPAGFLDILVPYVESSYQLRGVNYNKAVFVFLSNTGSSDISKVAFQYKKSGQVRETLQNSELQEAIMKAIDEDKDYGLWQSQLIRKSLVTNFIPFLPLERYHVSQCIRDAVLSQKKSFNIHRLQKVMDEVMTHLTFLPPDEPVFSDTGCKRAIEKINEVIV